MLQIDTLLKILIKTILNVFYYDWFTLHQTGRICGRYITGAAAVSCIIMSQVLKVKKQIHFLLLQICLLMFNQFYN
jgi:hypothetical protein